MDADLASRPEPAPNQPRPGGPLSRRFILLSLLSPLRAAYSAAEAAYRGRDRGMVCSKNDRAMDRQAKHFVKWLARMRFDAKALQLLQEEHVMPLLISSLHYIVYDKGGLNKGADLMAATLQDMSWFSGFAFIST
jgi:hypothetical protein